MATPTRIDHILLAVLSRQPTTANALAKQVGTLPLGGRGTSPGAVYPAIRRLEAAGLVAASPKPRNEHEEIYRRRYREWGRQQNPTRHGMCARGSGQRRRVQLYRLTNDGWAAVREWAVRLPGHDAMRQHPDELLLRFLVLAKLDPAVDRDERAHVKAPPYQATEPNIPPQWRIALLGARPHSHPGDEGRTRTFLEDYGRVALEVSYQLRRDLRRTRSKPRAGRHPLYWIDYDGSWEWRLGTELLVSLLEARAVWARRAAMELEGKRPIRRGPLNQVLELARADDRTRGRRGGLRRRRVALSPPGPRTAPSHPAGADPRGRSRPSW